jgi:hypothetical protein
MNAIRRKIFDLENNVLKLPEDDKIRLSIDDSAEMALHERAEMIKSAYRGEAESIVKDKTLSFEDQERVSEQLISRISKNELHIIDESYKFMRYRLMRLLYLFWVDTTSNKEEAWERIVWFFEEMDKLKIANAITDSQWDHNRNDEDQKFDDFKWWENVDAKIREVYPEGVFTEESWNKLRDWFDNKFAECLREYWKAHPEKFKEITQ